jgi:imidazolonepropionase-like amidohydrolase
MKNLFTTNLLATLILLAGVANSMADDKKDTKPIAVSHVTIIDVAGGSTQQDMTVVITGDRITSIGKTENVAIPDNAEAIDGAGKFLIPGLWDMHVHMPTPAYLPLFLANGVTGVREMHAFFPAMIFKMRQDIREGKLLGPRIVAAGAIIDGPKPFWPGSEIAGNEEEARKAVQSLKKRGADFIKVYTKLPRPAYQAIADEAKKQGLPFVGHVPESVSAAEASDLGQKSMEHLYGIVQACSTEEDKLRQEELEGMAKLDNPAIRPFMVRTWVKAMDTYNEEKAQALFAKFAKNGTWQDPTLTVLRAMASFNDETFLKDPRVKYMPAFLTSNWPKPAKPSEPPAPSTSPVPRGTPPGGRGQGEGAAGLKRSYQNACRLVTAMHKAGIRFLAGTDVTNPYCFPGFSLHDELSLLVSEAHFTPLEALQCATVNPAIFLGLERDLGTVDKGKIADLVLLDANPLDDIHNTQKIAAVFTAGRHLAKPDLQKMLKDAEGP